MQIWCWRTPLSRRHLIVRRVKRQVFVSLCPGAAPCIVRDRPAEEARLDPGEEILIGDTRLRYVLEDDVDREKTGATRAACDVATLLGGSALEVRGLLGVFALVESLDAIRDVDALRESVRDWARVHASSRSVDFAFGGDGDVAAPAGVGPSEVIVNDGPTETVLTVPAHTAREGWITFHLPARADDVGDALRRLLVVAGRICASRLAQLRALDTIADERESLRTLALGSARDFLGESAGAQQVARMLPRLSASDVAVLLTGETGTGKSFVARDPRGRPAKRRAFARAQLRRNPRVAHRERAVRT